MIVETGEPLFFDKVAQELNDKLFDLGQIDDLYAVARVGYEEDETFPEIYQNDGSKVNFRIMPDTLRSMSFFIVDGEMVVSDEDENMTIPMAIIVWFNLQKQQPGKKYDYTSELIRDVYNVLDGYGCYDMKIDINNPFEGFSMLAKDVSANIMRPYSAFRISFSKNLNICV